MAKSRVYNYKNNFKKYLLDLERPIPAPGGGSAAALVFCMGVSLVHMAFSYCGKIKQDKLAKLKSAKKKVLPFIDLDAAKFSQFMREKDKYRKTILLKEAVDISFELVNTAGGMLPLLKAERKKVTKYLFCDFLAGIEFIRAAVSTAFGNIKVNKRLLKGKLFDKKISKADKVLKKYDDLIKECTVIYGRYF